MEILDPRLFISTFGYIFASATTLALAVLACFKARDKHLMSVFVLMCLSIASFQISHLIGINISDHEISRRVFMWNLSNIFIAIFIAHWVLVIVGRLKKEMWVLILLYVSGISLFVFYLFNPYSFLEISQSKMYMPSYYEPGDLYWVMRTYFNIVAGYFFYLLIRAYYTSTNNVDKNRYKYVFWGLVIGFIFGSSALLLVWDIEFDPLWSMFFGLYTVPFIYAMISYELMDIRIVARRALLYAIAIFGIGVLLILLNFANDWISLRIPGWPFWISPLITSGIIVLVGFAVWRKLKETDFLKYEFITVVTHKFRTPLTSIKWASENILSSSDLPSTMKDSVTQIHSANSNLIELTNLLMGVTEAGESDIIYTLSRFDLSEVIKECIAENGDKLRNKNLYISVSGVDIQHFIHANRERIRSVIQILLENSISYSDPGKEIKVSVFHDKKTVTLKVEDYGMGISKEEMSNIFTKFYRAEKAKTMDTEGMGVGLSIAREIVRWHSGKIYAESAGEGMGSTFTFILPSVK